MAATKQNATRVGLPIGPLVQRVFRLAYRARKPILLEGETGIGKSELVAQVARDLNIGIIVLDLSLLEPPDLVGLPVIEGGRTSFAAPTSLPTTGAGLLLLEELNRAERYIQQPALQLLTARRLHEYVLPEGWLPCAAVNPDDGDYQVTTLDPALRSRFLHLKVRADRPSWVNWADSNGVHKAVLSLARRHEHFLDDTPPRTWTYVSDLLRHLGPDEASDEGLLRAALAGYLPHAWVELVVRELADTAEVGGIDIARLLTVYHKDAQLRKQVTQLSKEGRTDVLENLSYSLLREVDSPELLKAVTGKRFNLDAFDLLLGDLPGDHREALQDALGRQPVWSLLNVNPTDILSGSYPNSAICHQVQQWTRDPLKAHRVALLVAALMQQLENYSQLPDLRKNKGAMMGLGRFVVQVSPRWQRALDDLLMKKNIRPELPT